MRKLLVFNSVTLDGYFAGVNGDLAWSHKNTDDKEWNAFVADNSQGGGVLVLGRVTYQLMASFWPTANAAKAYPIVAERMNHLPKVVFSRTLQETAWNNTRLVKDNLAEEIEKMKNQPGEHMVILGSGSIVAQLAQEGLIDEYQIVVYPLLLGKGRTMFTGLNHELPLKLVHTRTFNNGNILLSYESRV